MMHFRHIDLDCLPIVLNRNQGVIMGDRCKIMTNRKPISCIFLPFFQLIISEFCRQGDTKIHFLGGRGTRSCIRVHSMGVLV